MVHYTCTYICIGWLWWFGTNTRFRVKVTTIPVLNREFLPSNHRFLFRFRSPRSVHNYVDIHFVFVVFQVSLANWVLCKNRIRSGLCSLRTWASSRSRWPPWASHRPWNRQMILRCIKCTLWVVHSVMIFCRAFPKRKQNFATEWRPHSVHTTG